MDFSGNTIISGNTGELGGGIAIASLSFSVNTLLERNEATAGGAIYSYYAHICYVHCVFKVTVYSCLMNYS